MDCSMAEGSVDEEQLAELLEMFADDPGEGGVGRAIDLFLTSMPTRLADLASAVADGRLDDAAGVAHSVKGSAASFAAPRLASLAGEVEQRAAAAAAAGAQAVEGGSQRDGIVTLLAALDEEFASFRRALAVRTARYLEDGDG